MSKIALTSNASGTGTFTIASPNSNTDRTLTLPDAAGSVVVNEGSGTFKIDSSGNVGIGTSSPSEKLSVEDSGDVAIEVKSTGTGDADAVVIIDAADTGEAILEFRQDGVAKASIEWFSGGSPDFNFRTESGTNGVIDFQPNNSLAMRITSSGNVAAGGTATNARLTIKENGVDPNVSLSDAAIMTYGAYGGGIALLDSGNPNSGSGYLLWLDDFSNDFNIAQGGTGTALSGGVYINNNAGSWSSRSDERDKINLEPITDAATKVQSLRAVTGEYIWAEGVRHPFLIAQDVQAVLPEAVSIANKSAPEEDQRLGMSYTDMVPLLTAALQEALTKIEALEARVAALEGASA